MIYEMLFIGFEPYLVPQERVKNLNSEIAVVRKAHLIYREEVREKEKRQLRLVYELQSSSLQLELSQFRLYSGLSFNADKLERIEDE